MTEARLLALAFLLYGLTAVGLLAVCIPPFQNPDELNHFRRAEQVANGRLLAMRFPVAAADGSPDVTAGGWADAAVEWAHAPFSALPFHPERRATAAMWAPGVKWHGPPMLAAFGNTAAYPPLFYVPAALGVLAGRATRASVVQTLVASRLLTGLVAVLIAAAGIAAAGAAAVWLFALLTLPMSLELLGACSQDALVLAAAAVAGTLALLLLRAPGEAVRARGLGLAAALILLAMARPPYALLGLVPLGLGGVARRRRLLLAAAPLAGAALWGGVSALTAYTNIGDRFGTDPGAQLLRLWHHPARVLGLAAQTLAVNGGWYLEQFVGLLGYLDTKLPGPYHRAALVVLGLAALASMLRPREAGAGRWTRPLVAAAVLLAAAGTFFGIYVTWTAVGRPIVDGVQGRYFLPLALAGVAGLPALGALPLAWPRRMLVAVIMLFPPVTLAVTMQAIVARYYLG